MKLIIKQAGFTGFTGQLCGHSFVNGLSTTALTHEQAMMIAAIMSADWINDPVLSTWTASTPVLAGVMVMDTAGAHIYNCTTPGTTAATAPAWPATPAIGATVVDGGVTWTFLETVDAGIDDVTSPSVQQLTDLP